MNKLQSNPVPVVQKLAKIYVVASIVRFVLVAFLSVIIYDMTYLFEYGISMVLGILPGILFYVHITKDYAKGGKRTALVLSYILGMMSFADSLVNCFRYILNYGFEGMSFGDYVYIVVLVALVISCVVLLFESANNYKHPKLSLRFAIAYLVAITINCADYTREILVGEYGTSLFAIVLYLQSVIEIVGSVAMYVFWAYVPKKPMNSLESENALLSLKNQLENNLITEQEYNKKKTEILDSWQ